MTIQESIWWKSGFGYRPAAWARRSLVHRPRCPRLRVRGEAHRQKSRASQEVPAVQPQSLFDFLRNPVAGLIGTTCLPRASAMVVAARLIAVWTR